MEADQALRLFYFFLAANQDEDEYAFQQANGEDATACQLRDGVGPENPQPVRATENARCSL